MNTAIITHCAWVLVAGGAFYLGSKSKDEVGTGPNNSGKLAASSTSRGVNVSSGPVAPKSFKPGSLAAKASDEALSWLEQYRNSDGTLSAEKMSIAIADVVREGDPVKSSRLFAQLLEELNPDNAQAALDSLRQNVQGFDGFRFMPLLAHAWAQKDGKAAVAAFDSRGGREAGVWKATAIAGWAAVDPDAAIAYRAEQKAKAEASEDEQQPGRGRGWGGGWGGGGDEWAAERGIVTGLARRSPEEAMNYLASLPDQEGRDRHFEAIAQEVLRSGVDKAKAWSESLTDAGQKREAWNQISRSMTRSDLDSAANWAASIAGQAESRDAVREVADEMARKDYQKAYEWANSLPDGQAKGEALGQAFSEWVEKDPVAASQALEAMPGGVTKDEAVQDFARTLAREDPESALAWAASIHGDEVKADTQVDVAREWLRSTRGDEAGRAAATNWIQSNLNQESQAQIMDGGWRLGGPGGPGGPRGRGMGGRGR
jgi:hypothetical protein